MPVLTKDMVEGVVKTGASCRVDADVSGRFKKLATPCSSSGHRADSFAKLMAGNVENGEAPSLLRKRVEIGLNQNLVGSDELHFRDGCQRGAG